jgi:hypothetical protein
MRYDFGCLLAFVLLTSTAVKAQLIADPVRASAARDTLLREAEQLQRGVAEASASFTTNARGHYRKRVVVIGLARPALVPSKGNPGQPQPVTPVIRWRHVTHYRRNGRVQERYRISVNGNDVLRERRLNGTVTWLTIPAAYSQVAGTVMRHRGLYLRSGYVRLDNQEFNLVQPLL